MSWKYEFVEVPTHTEKRCVGRWCDLCGKDTEADEEEPYEHSEFEISDRQGTVYPDGDGDMVRRSFDLCKGCRLVFWELMTRIGIRIQEEKV